MMFGYFAMCLLVTKFLTLKYVCEREQGGKSKETNYTR